MLAAVIRKDVFGRLDDNNVTMATGGKMDRPAASVVFVSFVSSWAHSNIKASAL